MTFCWLSPARARWPKPGRASARRFLLVPASRRGFETLPINKWSTMKYISCVLKKVIEKQNGDLNFNSPRVLLSSIWIPKWCYLSPADHFSTRTHPVLITGNIQQWWLLPKCEMRTSTWLVIKEWAIGSVVLQVLYIIFYIFSVWPAAVEDDGFFNLYYKFLKLVGTPSFATAALYGCMRGIVRCSRIFSKMCFPKE